MNFNVGQILYLLSNKTMKLVPVLVTEEVTRKSLEGEKISYNVMLPGKKRSNVSLDSIDAIAFGSIDELRAFMFKNAKRSINEMIEKTIFVANKELKSNSESDVVDNSITKESIRSISKSGNDENIIVDLGDGTKASIKVKNLAGVMDESIIVWCI